jgi:hypothetical protein
MAAFYTELVDLDKTEKLPEAKFYAQYAGYKRYGLYFKPEFMNELLAIFKENKIRKPEFRERKSGEWQDRLESHNHFYCDISISAFDKIRDNKEIALELCFD